jgi:hypothetical protein
VVVLLLLLLWLLRILLWFFDEVEKVAYCIAAVKGAAAAAVPGTG